MISITQMAEQPKTASNFSLQVSFKDTVNADQLPKEIAKFDRPRVIFWYIGAYGLKQEGVNFYRKRLAKLLELSKSVRCYLYDLSPWESFKKRETPLNRPPDPNVAVINALGQLRIQSISASGFFQWIKNENRVAVNSMFSEVIKTESLYISSTKFSPSNFTLGDLFNRSAPMLESQFNRDAAKTYSAVQYVEGIYLIDRLIADELMESNAKEIQLVFALPNDENKYYRDSTRTFASDVQAYLDLNWGEKLKGRNINITFFSFLFGNGMGNRPYNAGNTLATNLTSKDLGLK